MIKLPRWAVSTTLLIIAFAGIAHAQTNPPAAVAPATQAPPSAAPGPSPSSAGDPMEGLAAVYSDRLAGRKTASGQIFHQSHLTAAHPSLAFGTRVKVTNAKNNKSVVVRINDRGPTQAGRVIDLSRASAARIGIGKRSMAPVKLEIATAAPHRKAGKKG